MIDKRTKKSIKVILIILAILLVPFFYFTLRTYSVYIHNDAVNKVLMNSTDDKIVLDDALRNFNRAIFIRPNNIVFHRSKIMFLIKTKDYNKALEAARIAALLEGNEGRGYVTIGMIFEYMEEVDSSLFNYYLAIDKLKVNMEQEPYDILKRRQIALLYTFVGDTINAKEYMTGRFNPSNSTQNIPLDRIDFYIENYKSGGFLNYTEGNIISMVNDSISDPKMVDEELINIRIYYESYQTNTSNGTQITIYDFKEIFRAKAECIGFRVVD